MKLENLQQLVFGVFIKFLNVAGYLEQLARLDMDFVNIVVVEFNAPKLHLLLLRQMLDIDSMSKRNAFACTVRTSKGLVVCYVVWLGSKRDRS